MKHDEPSPLAGKTVMVKTTMHPQIGEGPYEFRVEDWWDRVLGRSVWESEGNPAAIIYAIRNAVANLPIDDEVVYGKIDGFGHIVHVSEIQSEAAA